MESLQVSHSASQVYIKILLYAHSYLELSAISSAVETLSASTAAGSAVSSGLVSATQGSVLVRPTGSYSWSLNQEKSYFCHFVARLSWHF